MTAFRFHLLPNLAAIELLSHLIVFLCIYIISSLGNCKMGGGFDHLVFTPHYISSKYWREFLVLFLTVLVV